MFCKKLVILVSFFLTQISLFGQETQESDNDLKRTFMPQFQLGYALNQTQYLSGGLMTQTSVEYRDLTNLVLRFNFDVFNSSLNLKYPLNDSTSFTGKTSFSDLIGGIGYRVPLKKHNITGYVQSGVRFYGYPEFNLDNDQISIDLSRKHIGVMRYTLGYEYALTPKLFFSIELFSSHVFKARDFWSNKLWSHGLTFGISAPLF
ncbi:MAG: hypothetical protein ACI9DK_001970 [Vicingaceae bacterium]|jgi:hypothetical protein